MFSFSRSQPFVVDQPRLLFEPLVPARRACLGEHEWPPLARQWRVLQRRLTQAAAAARDKDLGHAVLILAAGKTHVDRLNVAEVVALDDALLDQSLENAPTAAAVDAEFVGQ